jgi:hypothetical protein
MLKSTITVLFVITVVAFSVVSASILDASSNMNTAAYTPKKGHSSIYLNSYIKNCDDASYFIIVVLLSCPLSVTMHASIIIHVIRLTIKPK